ncbi:exonuclease V, chloroplastic-like isoform X1 [Neltuma alba]|uniref:exonuclease V, chloroplastic-like isoform X1 n=1 Tax=Neltuma alba TaxID=207710 RepID=UPI0010A4B6FB|nr:exonuclease V, chloroplastic-like isoform X1 [Prosopis alba]
MGETSSSVPVKTNNNVPEIPIEIVSDEEMAIIEAALAYARSFTFSVAPAIPSPTFPSQLHINGKSPVRSIAVLSNKGFSNCSQSDIEDSGNMLNTQKRRREAESYLHRFRKNRGLSITDITSTEWCQKQMEFTLRYGAQKITKAMKAGIARHVKLEEEIIKRVAVKIKSHEDFWALKFINFINGVNQLQLEGVTRELPIIGFAEGVWMVGVIDEIRLPQTLHNRNPILIDTKTRSRDTLPSEPQRRNGRLQLMCYKYMWDNLVARKFPSKHFFDSFGLNPHHTLCEDLQGESGDSGFSALTLDDAVTHYKIPRAVLGAAHDQLLLRYESQKDHSLLGEDKFAYDPKWLKDQIQTCLKFWVGEEEARYVPEDERWKCKFCQYVSICPAYTNAAQPVVLPNPCDDSNIKESQGPCE